MDVKLVLSIVVAAGMVVAAVFERRANKARARAAETAPSGVIIVVKVPESVAPLEAGRRYRVIKAFTDHDRDVHAQGEEWTFLRSAFVPYHSGLSWFVSFDGVQETHIRMQTTPEEQGSIVSNLAEYLVAV
jgi:uncharacterized protein DUF3601